MPPAWRIEGEEFTRWRSEGRAFQAQGTVCTDPQSCRSIVACVHDVKQMVFWRVKFKGGRVQLER